MMQSTRAISPTVGTTTEMMICVEWTRRTDRGPFVGFAEGGTVAELLAGIAEESAVSEGFAILPPMNVGKVCEGGTVAVHPLYPNSSLNEEYASLRNSLYAALL